MPGELQELIVPALVRSIREGQRSVEVITNAVGLKLDSALAGKPLKKHGVNMKREKNEEVPAKINPLDLVQEQYQYLKEKLSSANDLQEKQVLFRRLVNLVGVMQFLLSVSKNS